MGPEIIEDPVCGTNGKEYRNACFAKRMNVKVHCKGNCPCTKSKYEKTPHIMLLGKKDSFEII